MSIISKVCYLGAYDPDYPRNRILRDGLQKNGVQVDEARVSSDESRIQQALALLLKRSDVPDDCQVIVLAEMNFFLTPVVAWLIAKIKRKPLVVDYFFSIWDSFVKDRGRFRPRSLGAVICFISDIISIRLADHIIVDTTQHRRFFSEQFGVDPAKQSVVYIGADQKLFYPRENQPRRTDVLQVLFFGSFLPLHGIEVILSAAQQLEHDPIEFRIYGSGPTYPKMESVVRDIGLSKVYLAGPIPQAEVPGVIGNADVVLGIFGKTPKTTRVIPHKVFQGLAMRKAVITADTPAIREIFIPGTHLITCMRGEPQSLVASIRKLEQDESLRTRVAGKGYKLVRERFSPERLGHDFVQVMERFA